MIIRWLLLAATGLTLSGCGYLLPGPYDDALNTPPPTPRPAPFPSALDESVVAPWKSPAFHATQSQPVADATGGGQADGSQMGGPEAQ